MKETKMGSMLKEFRTFIRRGNVIDLAVAVVIGGSFGKIVTSLVNDVIMPPIRIASWKGGFQQSVYQSFRQIFQLAC